MDRLADRATCPSRVPRRPPVGGRELAEKILAGFPSCPIPEVARLGRTLKQWRDAFLGYFTTGGASNGGAEANNGLIELHRRIARGFRNLDNYRLTHAPHRRRTRQGHPHLKYEEPAIAALTPVWEAVIAVADELPSSCAPLVSAAWLAVTLPDKPRSPRHRDTCQRPRRSRTPRTPPVGWCTSRQRHADYSAAPRETSARHRLALREYSNKMAQVWGELLSTFCLNSIACRAVRRWSLGSGDSVNCLATASYDHLRTADRPTAKRVSGLTRSRVQISPPPP